MPPSRPIAGRCRVAAPAEALRATIRTSYPPMKNFLLNTRSLPLDDAWDVIVVGGGPTGCTAATAAAREGARTLLIESSGVLGGSGTSALVPAWCPFSDKEKIIYRGLAEKVFTAAKAGMAHIDPAALDWVAIDAERLKRVYDSLVTEAGASVLFHTSLAAVERAGDEVSTLLVVNKAGLSALRAKVYIDCTGDADVCAWAGVEFHQGDEAGDLMPGTHCFILTNVNEEAFHTLCNDGNLFHSANRNSPLYSVIESGRYPLIPDGHCCCSLVGPGTVGFNAGHLWGVDNTKPATISRALMQGRAMAQQYRDALAEVAPETFGNALLVTTGSVVGIRETRRVVGDYVLTLDDYLARRSFPDEICRNSYFIDIHHSLKDVEKNNTGRFEGLVNEIRYGKGESHGIPYRCLIPRGLKNVLVAGRSISCERIVQGSVRVMPVCLAMGEAAGLAAALAAAGSGADVRRVDPDYLRGRLQQYGGYLPDYVPEARAGADEVLSEDSPTLRPQREYAAT